MSLGGLTSDKSNWSELLSVRYSVIMYLLNREETEKENMAKKQTIYTVCKETNVIMRASRTFLAALQFAYNLKPETYYHCTGELELKKGQTMSNIENFL